MTQTGPLSTVSETESPRRDRVVVTISADRMAAWVRIPRAADAEATVTLDEVLDQLSAAGITHGLKLPAVEAAVDSAVHGEPADPHVLVAEGRPPVNGKDGTATFHPALSNEARRPKLLPDGTVDMFDLNTVRNVSEGTVLATVTPPTAGADGCTVTGQVLRAQAGSAAGLVAGRGTAFSPDQRTMTATMNGHAGLTLKEITVTDHYHILGDLGRATGNINFVGSVRITGNIQPGYSLRAQGDVEVLGSVEGATVEAIGNVTVHGGVVGGRRGTKISAKGFVKGRFIESAEVSAGGSVWAKDGIIQSRITAGDAVEVLGQRGVIVGGSIVAKNRICAHSLGSHIGTLTDLSVGIPSSLRAERAELSATIKRLSSQMEQADRLLQATTERIQHGDKSTATSARLTQAAALENEIMKALTQAQSREEDLDKQFLDGRQAFIQATERCFPSVRLTLSGVRHEVAKELCVSHFILDDLNQVAVVPGIRTTRSVSSGKHSGPDSEGRGSRLHARVL